MTVDSRPQALRERVEEVKDNANLVFELGRKIHLGRSDVSVGLQIAELADQVSELATALLALIPATGGETAEQRAERLVDEWEQGYLGSPLEAKAHAEVVRLLVKAGSGDRGLATKPMATAMPDEAPSATVPPSAPDADLANLASLPPVLAPKEQLSSNAPDEFEAALGRVEATYYRACTTPIGDDDSADQWRAARARLRALYDAAREARNMERRARVADLDRQAEKFHADIDALRAELAALRADGVEGVILRDNVGAGVLSDGRVGVIQRIEMPGRGLPANTRVRVIPLPDKEGADDR